MRIAVVLAVFASSNVAFADPRRDADEHARRGVAFYNLAKYEPAIDEFEQAYTLFQSDALLFNLAQAHRQLQHCERAIHYYKRFMEGNPTSGLAAQVESLLPKLEAACRTKLLPPAGPVSGSSARDGTASPTATSGNLPDVARGPVIVAGSSPVRDSAADVANAASPRDSPSVLLSGALSAGVVFAGRQAPTTGVRLTVTTPLPWLRRAELGGSVGVARLWRGDDLHNATLAQVAATIRYRAPFEWGCVTVAGDLGAAYFSSLGYSGGVIPGVSSAAHWAPLGRSEAGIEREVAPSFAIRVTGAISLSPRTGPMLSSVGELDLLVGLRYER